MENSGHPTELEQYPQALLDAVILAYPMWLTRRMQEISRGAISAGEISEVVAASQHEAINDLKELLSADVDVQRSNPLHVLRMSTKRANEALSSHGVQPSSRDEFEVSAMPHDFFSIGPLTWKDLSDDVHDAGIAWGAWKAAVVMMRRRDEGKLS